MRPSIGFGAERIGSAALLYPRVALASLLALCLLIAISLPRVSFDDDIHRVFLSDSPLSDAQRAYDAAQAPPLSTALVYLSAPAPFTAPELMALRALSLDLEFVDGVTAVTSPFMTRWPPTEAAPNGRPLFETEISADYAVDVAQFDALGTGLPTFLNNARTAMLISIAINTTQTDLDDATAAIRAELTRSIPKSITADITGEDVISAEIVSGLKQDLIALNLWGALITTLAAIALLRDLRMAVLAVVPALLGAASVLALSVWLGYPITVLSNVIPILLLVLGVADGVHLAGDVKTGGTAGAAVQKVGPACALTALTTAAAFASITLTGNAQLFEFAVLGALGTLLSFCVVMVTFATLARLLEPSARPIPHLSTRFASALGTLGTRRPNLTLGLCMAALVLGAIGFSQTKAWFPLYQNLPGHSETPAINDAVAADFGGVFQMIIESPADWASLTNVVTAVEAVTPAQSVLSEVSFARWLGQPNVAPTEEDLSLLPQPLVTRLRGPDGSARVFVSMPEPMRTAETLAQFDLIQETALQAGADRVIGLPTIMRQEAVTLISQLSVGLVVAALGATAIVATAFRSIRLIPILLIPNILPLVLTAAALHLVANAQLSPTAVLALTIAFGIAIDDTVHFLNRYHAARQKGSDTAQAVRAATSTAGQVMVLTTLLLTAGLCITLLSGFIPIRLFGGMMIITLWTALLVDLVLLPALLTRSENAPAVL